MISLNHIVKIKIRASLNFILTYDTWSRSGIHKISKIFSLICLPNLPLTLSEIQLSSFRLIKSDKYFQLSLALNLLKCLRDDKVWGNIVVPVELLDNILKKWPAEESLSIDDERKSNKWKYLFK